jgi:hypothetical protein
MKLNWTRTPKLEAPDRLEHWPLKASRSLGGILKDAAAADRNALNNQASAPLKHLEHRHSGWVHVLIGMIWVGRLFGQIPEEVVKRERAKVLEGVESVPKIGAPGPVAIWGQLAFPILGSADRQGNEQAVAAVAGYGKGRVVLFGQNGYLSGKAGGDHAKFLENVVSWSSGGKKKPRVGTWKMDEHEVLERAGFEVEVVKALGKAELGKVDVVVMNAQGVTDEADGLAVVEWVKAGGGGCGGGLDGVGL